MVNNDQPIIIDGKDGGGQVLRNGLSLSAIFNRHVIFKNIRGLRPVPGLQNQHLSCVNAIQELTNAEIEGNYIGSTELSIKNHKNINIKSLIVDIGTAGSITLVLQTVLPVLLFMLKDKIHVMLKGGTDVPYSPKFDYFRYVFLPTLSTFYNINPKAIEIKLFRRGTFPIGKGHVELTVDPKFLNIPYDIPQIIPNHIYKYTAVDNSIRPKKGRHSVPTDFELTVYSTNLKTLTITPNDNHPIDEFLEDQLIIYSKLTSKYPIASRKIEDQSDHTKIAWYVVNLF